MPLRSFGHKRLATAAAYSLFAVGPVFLPPPGPAGSVAEPLVAMAGKRFILVTAFIANAGDGLPVNPTSRAKFPVKRDALFATMPHICEGASVVHSGFCVLVGLRMTFGMLGVSDAFKIVWIIVKRIIVHMVDKVPRRNWSVMMLPDIPMKRPAALAAPPIDHMVEIEAN